MHDLAWKKGVKSVYDCRSMSIQLPDAVSKKSHPPLESTGLSAASRPFNDQCTIPLIAGALRAGST